MQFLLILGSLLGLIGALGAAGGGGKDDKPDEDDIPPTVPEEPEAPETDEDENDDLEEVEEEGFTPAVDIRISAAEDLSQDLIDAGSYAEQLLEGLFLSADDFGSQRVLNIDLRQDDIDGEGGTAALTSVSGIRQGQPTENATITFDRDDIDQLRAYGSMDEVMEHEMIHALGFGITWDTENLVGRDEDGSPVFTGTAATTSFQEFSGEEDVPAGVPLDGSEGHWHEGDVPGDVMNATVYDGAELSDITLASLADIGIPIDPSAYQDPEENMLLEEELLVA
ncbi:hypothetical protein LCGC14_0045590 [marine sediment metagenome]|uniref:Leishmanolysin n=2 Tax=root TaxID=1 RepID=A0A7V1BI02_9RHOB|nr:hypothetical protein [Sulfitobacter litoralis]HDZ53603.1 hypothetical protein [Sulfitobacter litoralis]